MSTCVIFEHERYCSSQKKNEERTVPGPTRLTLTPAGAKSTAKPLVRPSIDAITPDDAESPGLGFVSKVPAYRVRNIYDVRE